MKELRLGDEVLTEGEAYETIYSFGHFSPDAEAEYVQLSTGSHLLELSKDHMVFIEGKRAIPASSVNVGDNIETSSGYEVIKSIEKVVRQGAYAPFTASGTMVVNGVKASTFIAFQETETLMIWDFNSGLTFQFLAQLFETPHRLWCSYFTSSVEHYTDEGLSSWVALSYHFTNWIFDQHPLVMTMTMLPLLLVLIAIKYPVVFLIIIAAVRYRKTSFRRKSLKL